MKTSYFMGIDNGGSTTKCVIFDQNGTTIARASARVRMHKPGGGRTERDGNDVWQANCQVIKAALEQSSLKAENIQAVSMCGYGGGMILTDAQGFPVCPFIVSTDSRADSLLKEFQHTGIDDAVYSHTLQHLWSGQPGMLLPWFQKNQPDTLKQASHVMMIKDYIRYRLTGVIGTERTDASNTNLFDLHTEKFEPEIFRILGIENCYSLFPQKIFSPCQTAGYITKEAAMQTGLCPGTPVAAGLYDVAACTLASGILDDTILSLVVGTWSISGHLAADLESCRGQNNVMFSFLDGWYFSEESSPTSASNLDWFLEQCCGSLIPEKEDIYEYCNRIVSAMNPAESSLIFLPYLYGSNTAFPAKACFFQMEGHHTVHHMLAAVYEGILFSLLQHIDTLYGEQLPGSARFSGGASRSPVWCQMLADILGIPIEVMGCTELGALGCAICAAVACGTYPDYRAAVSGMCRVTKTYFPDRQRTDIYRNKYREYQKAVHCLTLFYAQDKAAPNRPEEQNNK